MTYLRTLSKEQQGIGFGRKFEWDIPLFGGYRHSVLGCAPGPLGAVKAAWLVRRQLVDDGADALLVTGWNDLGLITAAVASPVPVLVRGDSNTLRERSMAVRLGHRLLLRTYDSALFVGEMNRQFYLSFGLRRLFHSPHFVENDRFLKAAALHSLERDPMRAFLGFQSSDFVFAFCGKHVPFKRPMMLIEAAAQLRAKGYAVKLLMAGSGELTDTLKQHAAQLAVPAAFTGFLNQSELWKAYIPADAFVLPSTNQETWGLVTNEAMLFGLPVIVSDQVGCGPDLVVEGETGYVFSGEAAGLAGAMERLLAQGHVRMREMGRQARQHVLDHYSMANATAGLLAALDAVTVDGARS